MSFSNLFWLFGFFIGCQTAAHIEASLSQEPLPPEALRKSQTGIPGVQAAWTQIGPYNRLIARAITTASTCPEIKLDRQIVQMTLRSSPSGDFKITVCELTIPSEVRIVEVGSQTLHLLKRSPERIVVIGDTGCRIKGAKTKVQGCNSAEEWPFAKIADTARALNPDLVIHVGDYLYREAPCPPQNRECAGSSHGDPWDTWRQDFFAPALRLLESAPIILVRGNHEACSRAGKGWFKLLDPHPLTKECQEETPPYWIDLNDLKLGVIDVAEAANFEPSLAQLKPGTVKHSWLALHRPVFSTLVNQELTPMTPATPPRWLKNAHFEAILSGHMHFLAFQQLGDHRGPIEMISGNSGTQLDAPPAAQGPQPFHLHHPHQYGVSWYQYGFTFLERQTYGWSLKAYDEGGKIAISCKILESGASPAQLTCD